jgi:hypothetical protein
MTRTCHWGVISPLHPMENCVKFVTYRTEPVLTQGLILVIITLPSIIMSSREGANRSYM